MASLRSLKRRRSDTNISFDAAPVKVIVGPEKKVFYVHASALTSTSEFFKSALKEEWRKDDDSGVNLEDQSEEAFNTYLQWLYSGNSVASAIAADEPESVGQNYILLAKLYGLGEHLIDKTFQDYVINAMVAQSRVRDARGVRWFPTDGEVNMIYENTSAHSPARRLMVDFHVRFGHGGWIGKEEHDAPNYEFLIDLSRALLNECKLSEENEEKYDALDSGLLCEYHNHDKDKPCHVKET